MKTQMLTHKILCLSLIIFSTLVQPSLSELCHPEDKKVLLKIKQAFNNPYHLASWDPKSDCCNWYCLKCDEKSGRVVSLFFVDGDTVAGPIPPVVAELPYLQTIDFHKCPNIVGPIPPSIAKLKYLKYLMITNCNVSGPIPDFLGRMETLEYISLAFNKLTGPIPSSIASLPKLTGLRLDRNKLTGPIPDSFGSFKSEDFYLYLSHNQLSGKIPASLGKKDFSYVDLSRNKLEGDAALLFGSNKKKLFHLDLSRNSLSFDFSKVKFPETMVSLDINHNKIFGSLPPDLAKLSLQIFNVSYNLLCRNIPYGGQLQQFDATAYFHNKCLCGAPLPKCK